MPTLDARTLPLTGRHLVEASAGTGKTWTIGMVVLRLLVERGLPVEKVLVVTYTKAATAELRDRLRQRVRDALRALDDPAAAWLDRDPVLRDLVAAWPDATIARQRLDEALRTFDLAPVLTIHSFCQRALRDHAFESGAGFDVELLEDDRAFVADAAQDLWTSVLWDADRSFVEWVQGAISPDDRLDLVRAGTRAARPRIEPPPPPGRLGEAADAWRAAVDAVRAAWRAGGPDVGRELFDRVVGCGGLKGTSYRRDHVDGRIRRLADAERTGRFPLGDEKLFDALRSLSPAGFVDGAKPGVDPSSLPDHPVFDACGALVEARATCLAAFEDERIRVCHRLVDGAADALARVKGRDARGRFFDDLIADLAGALRRPVAGPRLAQVLRDRYPAALIDEFQDTDPVQWEVFDAIHPAGTPGSLFLIGDPKQAIYAFRGADLHAYLAAAAAIGDDHTWRLDTNWRSDAPLVEAVELLFRRPSSPFDHGRITYPEVRAKHETARLTHVGRAVPPLRFTVHPGDENGRVAKADVPDVVASQVVDVLRADLQIGDRDLRPGDVAILVHANAEARELQEALRRRGVPSVRYGAQSVFETPEADDLRAVLEAVLRPNDVRSLRAALVTPLLGQDAVDLHRLERDEGELQGWMGKVRTWRDTWEARGFMRLFQRVLAEEAVLPRLLGRDGGDRRVTNYRQLAERLHHAEQERGLRPAGCVAWLGRRIEAADLEGGEAEMRLESDAEAVQIVTMHASKGLEYPVVFLPQLWKSAKAKPPRILRFHDAAGHQVLHVAPDPAATAAWYRETRGEGLRLAYVALTRARHLCFVHVARVWSAEWWRYEDSPLAHLLHPPAPGEPVGANAAEVKALSVDQIHDVLRELVAGSGGRAAVRLAPAATPSRWTPPARPGVPREPPAPPPARRPDVRVSSYSALVRAAHDLPPDAAPERDVDAGTGVDAASRPATAALVLAGFPRGARAGVAYHAVCEHLDFTACTSVAPIRDEVRRQLATVGLADESWVDAVARSVVDVVHTPLGDGEAPGPRLVDVPRHDRLDELEFLLGVGDAHGLRAGPLAAAFAEALPPHLAAPVAGRLASLAFVPVRGALRGFVDLTFRHAGRLWIVDYKTNHLGDSLDDYAPAALDRAMVDGDYVLQYHLYAVALRRWLRQRAPGASWDATFGGVRWLFVRGITPTTGPTRGVFADRPDDARLDRIERALSGEVA